MPSFVLSLALLLLVLLTLLAVSNRELIALTFLGFSTVALPLSIWIGGAIALGFLLGLWILLLFRFGTAGLGSGSPAPGRRRANYGPEDFAVVDDERFAEGADRYDDGRYSENRYDDVYGQGQSGVTASQEGYQGYATNRDYPAEAQSSRDGRGDYGSAEGDEAESYSRTVDDYGAAQQSYSEPADEPQDRFSAASGYESGNAASRAEHEKTTDSRPRTDASKTTLQDPRSAVEPSIPADWDDQYREDWTQEELFAEPILRDEGAAPKLKRLFRQSSEGRPKLNLGGFGLGGAAEAGADNRSGGQQGEGEAGQSSSASGEVADWQGAIPGDRYDSSAYNSGEKVRGEVYDADYRVVRQPEDIAEPSLRSAAAPQPWREAPEKPTEKESQGGDASSGAGRDRPQSEWDIESDLDW